MSEFKELQELVCDLPEPIEPPQKVCPTCEPDPNYIEPTWWETTEPYLNKQFCEYRVCITPKKKPSQTVLVSTNSIKAFSYKFVKEGLEKILRKTDKLQTNQILCAYPPDSMNDRGCLTYVPPEVYLKLSDIELFVLNNTYDIPDQKELQDRLNPLSLEYGAKVEDFYLGDTLETFKILISIPAEMIDRLPGDVITDQDAEEIDEEAMTTESVEFKGKELGIRTRELSATFRLYAKYQQVAFIVNKIMLLQENIAGEEVKFRIGKFVKKDYFKDFRSGVEDLLEKNGFKFRNFDSFKTAHKIKFVYDKTNSERPYEIKAAFAAKKGCPYEKLKIPASLKNNAAFKNQTFMHYISKIEELTDQLREGTETPWMDFLIDNTYPALSVDFGDIDNGEDSADTCIDPQVLNNLKDDLLGDLLSFSEALQFALSSSGCRPLEESTPVHRLKIEFKTRQARKLNRARRKAERKEDREAKRAAKAEKDRLKEENSDALEKIDKEIKDLKKEANDAEDLLVKIGYENEILEKELEKLKIEAVWTNADSIKKKVAKQNIKILENNKKIKKAEIEPVEKNLKESEKELKNLNKADDDGDVDVLAIINKEGEIDTIKETLATLKVELKEIDDELKKARYDKRDMNAAGQTFNMTSDKVKAGIEDALLDFKPFGLIDEITEAVKNREERGDNKLRNILQILNPCKWKSVSFDVVSCLLGGLSLQEAIPIIVEKTLMKSSPFVLEELFTGLSIEKQQEVADKVRNKLRELGVTAVGDIVTPWEQAKQEVKKEVKITSAGNRQDTINSMRPAPPPEPDNSEAMTELKKQRKTLKDKLKSEKEELKEKQKELSKQLNNQEALEATGEFSPEGLEIEIQTLESDISELEEQLEAKKQEIDEKRQDENNQTDVLGDIATIVFQAYVEAMIESLPVDDLTSFIDRIPGAKVFKKIFLTVTCPTTDNFKTNLLEKLPDLLKIEFCKDGGNGWAIPKIPKLPEIIIPNIQYLLKKLIEILKDTLINLIAELLIALILKVLDLLSTSLCNSIGALGNFLADAAKGEASLDGLLEAVGDAFCNGAGDPNTMNNLLGKAGIPESRRADIANSISQTVSKNDIKKAFLNGTSQDPRAMKSMYAAIVGNGGFEGIIESPEDVGDIFTTMGSFLGPEQKLALTNSLDEEGEYPVDQSICLTNSQKEAWDQAREDYWANRGLGIMAAKDYINKLNNDSKNDLGNMMDLFNQGTEGILADALGKALQPPDNSCADKQQGSPTSIIPTMPQEVKDILSELSEGMFKTLFFSFTRDMVGSRNSYFDNVLADMRGIRLSSGFFNHERRVDYNLLFPNAANTEEQHAEKLENARFLTKRFMEGFDGEAEPNHLFPQTVGVYMKDQLAENIETLEFISSDSDPTLQLTYKNENYNSDGESEGPDFKFNLNYFNFLKPDSYAKNDTYRVAKIDRNLTDSESSKYTRSRDYNLKVSHGVNNVGKVQNFQIPETLSRPYINQIFVEQIKSSFEKTSATIDENKVSKQYDAINQSILSHLIPELTSIEGAFEFGFEADEIGYEDLLYVDPDATSNKDTWEYTHEEDEGILGKSATGNPRVKFLDPAIHGGRYTRPKFYIDPAEHSGMFRKLQMLVPEFDGCDPARSDFLNLKEISDKVSNLQNSIPMDERMSLEPDCRIEPPFDKLHTPNGLAYLEGVIKATVRTYVVEFLLRTMPFISTIKFNPFNYDDAVLEMIVDKMQEGHRSLNKNFSNIRNYNYWILFVEETVTATFRQVKDGEIQPTAELKEVLQELNDVGERYYNPTRLDRRYINKIDDITIDGDGNITGLTFKRNLNPSDRKKRQIIQMIHALCFYGYGPRWRKRLVKAVNDGKKPKKLKLVTLRKLKTATRMFEVHKNIETAKKVVKHHVQNELKFYADLLDETMKPQSPIYDINKYLIGASKFLKFSDIEAGLSEVESPVGNSTSIDYGSIPSCPTELGAGFSHFDGKSYTTDEYTKIKNEGVFHLEKFVYVTPKQSLFETQTTTLQQPSGLGATIGAPTQEREEEDSTISTLVSNLLPQGGVMSIGQFRGLMNQLSNEDKDLHISEALGNAVIDTDDSDNPSEILGTIGLRFGVRLCYTPPQNPSMIDFYEGVTTEEANKFKSYKFKKATVQVDGTDTSYLASRYTFPVITYMQDVVDKKLNEIDLSDDNLGEDLKCYVDRLCLTDDYRLLFHHVLITRKLTSLLLMYSYDGFIESIGLSIDEREEDKLGSKGRWKSKILRNTKKQLRNLFAGFYREMEDPSEKEEQESRGLGLNFLKSFSPAGLINMNASIKWWQLRRMVDRPYDKDGNDCDDGIF
jgi:hypothetical protein